VTHYPRSNRQSNNFIPVAELRRIARGRWREILVAAGVPAVALDGLKGRPCPRCGGKDRFAPMRDLDERGALLCRSCHHGSSDPRCGDGIAALRWWLGVDTAAALRWLSSFLGITHGNHVPLVRVPVVSPQVTRCLSDDDRRRFELMARVFRSNLKTDAEIQVADDLGVSPDALRRLSVGWSPSDCATTWPMRADDGNVIGIRLRCPRTARKWAAVGSMAGLFYDPEVMDADDPIDRLWIVEGPTDCSALLSIGLDVVGVPSAGGAADLIVALARRVRPHELVIVADRDDAGRRGAERLSDALVLVAQVRVITPSPGIKDSRAWVGAGVDSMGIERVADAAPIRRISLHGGASS